MTERLSVDEIIAGVPHEFWKYKLDPKHGREHEIEMPAGAVIWSCQTHFGVPCIWLTVDPRPGAEKVKRHFELVFTGERIVDSLTAKYIGTVQLSNGEIIVHVIERMK